jgi:hypothetical protein
LHFEEGIRVHASLTQQGGSLKRASKQFANDFLQSHNTVIFKKSQREGNGREKVLNRPVIYEEFLKYREHPHDFWLLKIIWIYHYPAINDRISDMVVLPG